MAYTPFAESDRPSRENFNAKFADAIAEAKSQALSAGVRIVTGSYVGTGTYGEEHPVRLEFDFDPALVVITGTFGRPNGISNATVCFINPGTDQLMTASYYLGGSVGGAHYYKFDGNALLMYDNDSYGKDYLNWQGAQQANMAGETYYYIAIGQGVEA